MKNTFLTVLAVTAATFATVATASAQVAQVQKPYVVKLGVFLPINGTLKSSAGSPMVAAGVEYELVKTESATPTIPLVYADFQDGRSHKGYFDSGAIGVGVKQYLPEGPDAKTAPYVGAGVGVYFTDAKIDYNADKNIDGGFKLDAGVEFNHSYLVEADFTDSGKTNGVKTDGFNILAGYRF